MARNPFELNIQEEADVLQKLKAFHDFLEVMDGPMFLLYLIKCAPDGSRMKILGERLTQTSQVMKSADLASAKVELENNLTSTLASQGLEDAYRCKGIPS
jgi:hypothetical protein